MRRLTTILLITGVCGAVHAHELQGLEGRLHGLLSLHHLPALLLVAFGAGIVLCAIRRRRANPDRNVYP